MQSVSKADFKKDPYKQMIHSLTKIKSEKRYLLLSKAALKKTI